jgi:hypothetical protein
VDAGFATLNRPLSKQWDRAITILADLSADAIRRCTPTAVGANSQKAGLGIHLKDLSDYIDRQHEKAAKEQNQLMGRSGY